jgi:hypothetical protein
MWQNIFVVRRLGGIWPPANHGHFLLLTADPRQAQNQSGNSHSQPFNRSLLVFLSSEPGLEKIESFCDSLISRTKYPIFINNSCYFRQKSGHHYPKLMNTLYPNHRKSTEIAYHKNN